ncbi:MAG: hypothetical protein FJY66_06150, partial [Calditrichaeota bacterium]|nr:hypothetical protein [Calditrichota bacterium]
MLCVGCTRKKGVAEEGGPSRPVGGIYLKLSRTTLTVEPGGSDTVSVSITVFDANLVGIEGADVEMKATGGAVGQPAATDANGQTTTLWSSAGDLGTFDIIAIAGGRSDTARVQVNSTESRFGILRVSAYPLVIYADH